jgi:hypothetical protein
MGGWLDNPIAATAVFAFLVGLAGSGLARLARGPVPAALVMAAVFFASYLSTYQQVPPFPPLGSTNKIFYVAAAATLLGLLLDLVDATALWRGAVNLALPLAIVAWIALPRMAEPDAPLMGSMLALWLGGAAMLWRLASVASQERDGGSLVAIAMLAAIVLGFAPVALVGASSTSLQLCFGIAFGLGGCGIWELAWPRRAFTATALLGAGCGFLAAVDTVALITRQLDYLALALLLPILVAGQWGARVLFPRHPAAGRVRQVLVGIIAALPLILVLAALLLRHPDGFES